jgi:hypothetical protein
MSCRKNCKFMALKIIGSDEKITINFYVGINCFGGMQYG